MEQKKLISILHRDMSELEELIDEIKEKVASQAPEIKFLHTRAQGMKELVEILYQNTQEKDEIVMPDPPKPLSYISEEIEQEPEEIEEEDCNQAKEEPEEIKEEETFEEEFSTVKNVIDFEPASEEAEEENSEEEDVGEELPENEEQKSFGESFKREATLNDRAADNKKLDYKLGHSKIESLQSAIGVNDRFLFIRELFDGDAQRFKETIATIDSRNSLKEAVDYLSQNFKWKKSDASISFVNLLKRRF